MKNKTIRFSGIAIECANHSFNHYLKCVRVRICYCLSWRKKWLHTCEIERPEWQSWQCHPISAAVAIRATRQIRLRTKKTKLNRGYNIHPLLYLSHENVSNPNLPLLSGGFRIKQQQLQFFSAWERKRKNVSKAHKYKKKNKKQKTKHTHAKKHIKKYKQKKTKPNKNNTSLLIPADAAGSGMLKQLCANIAARRRNGSICEHTCAISTPAPTHSSENSANVFQEDIFDVDKRDSVCKRYEREGIKKRSNIADNCKKTTNKSMQ